MKKFTKILLLVAGLSHLGFAANVFAQNAFEGEPRFNEQAKMQKELPNYALMLANNLPHLMKPLMKHRVELGLSDIQLQKLQTLRQKYAPQIHQGLEIARDMELQLSENILQNNASLVSIKPQLDALERQKRQNAEKLILAIAEIRKVLSTEQFEQLLAFSIGTKQNARPMR